MKEDNHIKKYSAADIEKYHKGLLSVKEMHDLEKAALDDPFLADALEGYAVSVVTIPADIDDLRKRLEEKIQPAKVISLHTGGKRSYPWLRAAAILVLLVGAGLLARVFIFTDNEKDNFANADKKQTEIAKRIDTVVKKETANTGSTVATNENNSIPARQVTNPGLAAEKKTGGGNDGLKKEIITPADDAAANKTVTPSLQPPVTAAGKVDGEKSREIKTAEGNVVKEGAKEEAKRISSAEENKQKADKDIAAGNAGVLKDQDSKTLNRAAAPRKADNQYYNQSNVFRGRVTDGSNTGLPFANVTNLQDNVGTYTDAKGYFNLTSPDSVLNVQIRSLGFEDNNVQLRNTTPQNQVVMQNDRRDLSEVVISSKKPNAAARSRNATVKVEEPEPADGWDNYDTYLANNLKVPEDFESKQTSRPTVEISFEVDKNGEPVNIKVEKSLCSSCDREAIRLIKEGPKWKRKAKKGRTSVTVKF